MHGADGPEWEVTEVQSLVEKARRGIKLSRPWLWIENPLKEQAQALEQELAEALKARPGAARLPAPRLHQLQAFLLGSQQAFACSGCGQRFFKLQCCSGCKVAAYCR